MTTEEKAKNYFNGGFNCAQAVFVTFGPRYGMSEEHCLRTACAFGAGMGRTQNVCGAVTGAFMVLGLRHGSSKEGEEWKKAESYRQLGEFARRFTALHGSTVCKELLGYDISNDEGLASAKKLGLFANKCAKYVSDAVKILEEMPEAVE